MRRRWIKQTGVVGLMSLTACYSGLGDSLGENAGGDAGLDDGDDDGDDGDDGNEGGEDPAQLCSDSDIGATSLRRLTASQYKHTIGDLLGLDGDYAAGFAADERAGAFKSNGSASVGELQVEQYLDAAESVALDATADLDTLLSCDGALGDPCAEDFLADFAQRAFRRPLTPVEFAGVVAVYRTGKDASEGSVQDGLRVAISAVLQSPYFLYHVEFGVPGEADSRVALDGYELASRLSYFLWDSMPDGALFEAVATGSLEDVEGISAEVERMLASPKAKETVASFHEQWLGVDELETSEKNAELFPEYDVALAASMRADVAAFANWVISEQDGRLETLLTANVTLSEDPQLLALYGVELPPGHVSGTPIELPAGERAGLLTMAGVMAKHAHPDATSPILRGVMLRQDILCTQLPPPPPEVDNVPPSPDPNATTREQFAQHTADPACAGCHQLIDPLGFAMESYDAIGAFRTTENGKPIDNSGEVIGADISGTFNGGVELSALLTDSASVQQCVSRQWFRYALGRIESPDDACAIEGIHEAFEAADFDVRVLLRAIVLSSAFRFRKGAV
ncbi:MAG: DUF1592 domain-containing protein [Nannocystaceae bacterium]|nr:DUF1592 domain-containing protein [Nannocystaceae bacterium]